MDMKLPPLVIEGCLVCGGKEVYIRGKHPGDEMRLVCPTCLMEKIELLREIISPSYGVASQEAGK